MKYPLIVFMLIVVAKLSSDFLGVAGKEFAAASQAARDAEIDNQFTDAK